MKHLSLLIAILLVALVGCAVPECVQRDYYVGTKTEATVGSPLMSWTYGSSVVDCQTRQLIYTGVDHGVVHIAYREYYNNMARPAFSHDLWYDISKSGEISFQDVKIKIDGANQKVINYTVVEEPRIMRAKGNHPYSGANDVPGVVGMGMLIDKEGHILRVFDFNAAKRAGLREGDEVLQVDSKPLPLGDLGVIVSVLGGEPGTEVDLVIRRNGEEQSIHVTRQKFVK